MEGGYAKMSKAVTFHEVPIIANSKELSQYLKPLYIIEDVMKNDEDYKYFEECTYNIIKGCFEHKECREHPVKFKFYKTDKKTHTVEFRHFIINMFLWSPFTNLYGVSDVMDESFIIDCYRDIPNVTDYINEKIILVLREYGIKNVIINRSVSEALYNLRRISTDFSAIMNLNISMETFLELYDEHPRIREIMETKFTPQQQPNEIEHLMNELTAEEVELIKGVKDNALGVILRSGTGIKHKQLAEYTIAMSMKPDLSGVTIPIPISSSTLIGGLNKPSYHYIDAIGARKSLIMNKKVMGTAGYFGKVVLLLARTLSLSKTVSDCDTKHLLEITIESKKMLKKYDGRYYKLDEHKGSTLLLNAKRDTHLVGKTIYLRSPITCACANENEVCHKCFGTTSLLNLDIADGVTGFEVEETTKVVNQMILSTKHLLTTISEAIEFNDNFYKFFSITAGEINPILANDNVENLDEWAIWIDPNDIQKSDEMDDDSFFNTYINGKFYVYNTKTKDYIEIFSKDEREMYLTDECLELMKKGKGFIKFKDMDENTSLFELVIMNNELTKPLYDLIDLLNKSKKDDVRMTYNQMAQKFTELLLQAGIGAMALSGEVIINRLIRQDPDETFSRPDFSKTDIGDYQIYTILKALEYNKSPLIGLSSQNIKRQLLSDDIVTKKSGTSYIDAFFKVDTPTDRLREIHEIVSRES